jgi:hypothetical protein
MTFDDLIRWLKDGQRAVQQSQRRQLASAGFSLCITACLVIAVIGTTNPLLLFNPNFQPSWAVRFCGLWGVAFMASVWVKLVDNAIKAEAPRLFLHMADPYFETLPAIDAPFFDPERK